MRLRSSRSTFICFVAMELAAASLRAQVDLSAWPKVQVAIMATDASGDPIPAPSLSGIIVHEDGKQQTVLDLSAASQPQSVCILVDSSGSMYSRMPDVQAAAARFLQNLPPEDEVCFASFGWILQMRRKFTYDHTKIATSIQAVRAAGGTSLRDALVAMEDYMRTAAKNRLRAIVVLTDGADNASAADERKMVQAMKTGGSPVVHIVRVPGHERCPQRDCQRKEGGPAHCHDRWWTVLFPKRPGRDERIARSSECCDATLVSLDLRDRCRDPGWA